MLQKSRVILAATAALAACGAVQIASVEASPTLAERFLALGELAGAPGINRDAKGDRASGVTQGTAPARTVLLRIDGLVDTSVLVRVPVQKDAQSPAPAQTSAKPAADGSNPIVACEPVVSVLTEVAKLLQPGKCVT